MRRYTTLAIILALPPQVLAANFDTSQFQRGLDVNNQEKVTLQLKLPEAPKEASGAPVSVKVLEKRIGHFATLIETARNPAEKAEFQISLAVLKLQKARLLANENKDQAQVVAIASEAGESARAASTAKGIKNEIKAYSLYLAALSYVLSGQREKSIPMFENLLKISTEAPYAPGIVLYLADTYGENEKHARAVELLKKTIPKLPPAEQGLAVYKLAWSYIGMQQFKQAESELIKLVQDPGLSKTARDAVKELAYVSTQVRNEAGIVKLADELFAMDADRKAEFLSSAWSSLQRLDVAQQDSLVFKEMMGMASDYQKRIQLWLEEIQANRRNYASSRAFASLNAIQKELSQLPSGLQQKAKKAKGEEIVLELEQLIRSYVDTFTKREPNKEKLAAAKMTAALQKMFEFHTEFFPEAKNRALVFDLWTELCHESKDHECAFKAAQRVLADKTLTAKHAEARAEKIVALDQLARADKNLWQDQLVTELERYSTKTDAPHWSDFMKLYADVLVQQKQFDKAVQLLTQINAQEASSTSFHRLQMARFLAGQYRQVVQAKPPPNVEKSAAVNELVREAALKLAMQTRDQSGNIQEFEANVDRFLSLNQDAEKEGVVIADYVKKLLDVNDLKKATDKIASLKPEKLSHPKLAVVAGQVSLALLRDGQVERSRAIIPSRQAIGKAMAYERALTGMANGIKVDPADFKTISPTQKNYLLRLLALARPEQVQALGKFTGSDPESKKILTLALQMQNSGGTQGKLTRIETLAAKIVFPKPGDSGKRCPKAVEYGHEECARNP